jgi:23S rRNA (uracil747-C5)-methyltransferase
VRCGYYDAGLCRSCSWLPTPYVAQVDAKQRHAAELLAPWPDLTWLPPVTGPEEGFRNKAKMVVAGTVDAPTLGILDATGHGTDLRACGLHEPVLHDALPALAAFVTRARLTPYDVPTRTGELKHVLATVSPDGELMVRFVLRSTESLARIRKHLPSLWDDLPHLRVVSANLQPRHAALLEGEHEELLLGDSLAFRVDGITLHLRPQSFFQTNTGVATALYREGAAWVDELDPASVWDLYCGVGGFALHLARSGRDVVGIEVSAQAVEAARLSAAEAGVAARFEAADATTWMAAQPAAPELVVVNPPRRGIGPDLAAWLDRSDTRHVLYSSCNPTTLARDLAAMPSLEPVRARVFDMFPQTGHQEVLVLCARAAPPHGSSPR